MYAFSCDQESTEVGGIVFGGQPGENPTVCMSTLFYGESWGKLDEENIRKASKLVQKQEELSRKLSVPALVDVYVKKEDVKEKLDFIIEASEEPFSIDASSPEARSRALEYAGEKGVLDRVIYNSINLGLTHQEYETLREHTPEAAILLAYNPKDSSVDGRLEMLSTGAGMVLDGEKGLLDLAHELGVKKLIDTAATPFGQQSAESLRSIPVVKNKYGLPTGCALHNTLESWDWMKDEKNQHPDWYTHCSASANCLIPYATGDYTVYGSIENMEDILPAIAFTDKLLAEGALDYFGVDPSKNHPYHVLE